MSGANKSRATRYRGSLSPFQIADGLRATKRNAERLLRDAAELYDLDRFPSATSLAILSIEELGKIPILRRMALADGPEAWRVCWRDFGDHLTKCAQWGVPFLVKTASSPEALFNEHSNERDPLLLDSIKQLGFYVGCYGNAHWAEPARVVEKAQADPIFYAARVLAAGSQSSELDTPSAVQLWSNTMAGYFRCGAIEANNAVVNFFRLVRERGVVLAGDGIPPSNAFEFLATVMYISGDDSG